MFVAAGNTVSLHVVKISSLWVKDHIFAKDQNFTNYGGTGDFSHFTAGADRGRYVGVKVRHSGGYLAKS